MDLWLQSKGTFFLFGQKKTKLSLTNVYLFLQADNSHPILLQVHLYISKTNFDLILKIVPEP